eukprot:CCRYP_013843-RA/>CCRYP_013843-RA protein AED:0.06 eAED:0.06 QI:123/1/1/1/1/0.66/3/552/225
MARTCTFIPALVVALLQRHCHAWTTTSQSSSTWPPHCLPSKLAATSHSGSNHDMIPNAASSRRGFFNEVSSSAALLFISSLSGFSSPSFAQEDDDDLIDVYFGCGCFWHVQHEFVEAERRILSRPDDRLTSRAGYAGANPPSTAKCVITMPPTLPTTDRWDTRRWCRCGYPLDPLENSPRSIVSCSMRMGCDRINLETGVGSIGIWWVFPGGRIRCMPNCWWRPV